MTAALFSKQTKVHFVGIGGIGMSGIAEVLVNLGYAVSGSDLKSSASTERLRSLGARVYAGHGPGRVDRADVVVVSSAVRPDNPEVEEARRLAIPIIPRAEMLAELMRLKYGIAVAGSHGKTTTTSMIAVVLDRAGLDPTMVIGGRITAFGTNARLGGSDLMVVEADESDRSFLRLSPVAAVVTGIDREHMEAYRDAADLEDAFLDFVNKVPFYGASVVCLDDERVQDILPRIRRRYVTYGFSAQADVSAEDLRLEGESSSYRLKLGGSPEGEVRLRVPGRVSVVNSLAAIGIGRVLGLELDQIRSGLESFSGVDRRFQVKADAGGILVVDDYGHHPTEIRAVLQTAKESFGRRTVVVFQPHRYSRVRDLFEDFCHAFHQADVLFVTEIYAAGEEPIESVSGERLARGIESHGHRNVRFVAELDDVPKILAEELREGDLMMTLGAGSVTLLSDRMAEVVYARAH
ncbi:MAG TPA: UDP-N-acetylmuramate--L-alanine ligase [Vicinamibacteria bacterium]|nr:UDP-N-acetylmuramate--L-alanine ligase [Vicinamibacteria bacterium]